MGDAPLNGRAALVAGGSGLVGGLLLPELLAAPKYERVVAVVRRPLALKHAKLEQLVAADLAALESLPASDDAFCCLGTTRAKAGSAEAFRAVDFDLALAFARLAHAAKATRFLLVSSSGAKAASPFLYPRVKAETEAAVGALGFPSTIVARPSLLLGARAERRPTEELFQKVLSPILPLVPARFRPIEALVVARALRRAAFSAGPGVTLLENEDLLSLGA